MTLHMLVRAKDGTDERGVLGMRARRLGTTWTAAALTIGAASLLLFVAGTAPAAPQNKVYDATVRVANAAGTKLTLTLINDSKSKQTIGSANFVPPEGVVPSAPVVNPAHTGWTAAVLSDNTVAFRSTSNALSPGESVSVDVDVAISKSTCTNATVTTFVKQSNDFSGAGNDFAINASLSNLRPVGSFDLGPIETVLTEPDPDLHVPQILVSTATGFSVTAYDVCGDPYVDYGSGLGNDASLAPKPDIPARLQGATISAINWSHVTAVGTASLTPVVVETGDKLVVSDPIKDVTGTTVTTISDESNEFDVVEKLCTSLDTECTWEFGNGKIRANAPPPPAPTGGDVPSIGLGFSSSLNFECPGGTTASPVGGALVNINPRDYPTNDPITVTLVYKKSETGSGPASGFVVCISKDNGETWGSPLAECPNSPQASDAPCVTRKRVTGGDLSVAYFIRPTDPWGGAR